MNDGYCAIKEEYVIKKLDKISSVPKSDEIKNDIQTETVKSENGGEPPLKRKTLDDKSENGSETLQKRRKLDDENSGTNKKDKQKNRGLNKGRPKPVREANDLRPCPSIVNVQSGKTPDACKYNSCSFIHDPLAYLQSKPKDISLNDSGCYVHRIRGECPWGISCRFGSSHISPEGYNLIDTEKAEKWINTTTNNINFESILKLQKRKYDFKEIEKFVQNTKDKKNNGSVKDLIEPGVNSGAVTDEDVIKTRDCEKVKINWRDKLYLGPLTTLGNLPFRRICKEFGADITCGEMTMCDSLLKGNKQEWALVKRHASEDLFGVQICGTNPFTIAKVSDMIRNEKEINVDFVDLNLGCPIDLVYQKGGGCGMLIRTNILETSVRCASEILPVPFTIKTRTGIHQEVRIAHQLAPKFFSWGAAMLTVHGRSREQRYTKFSNWEYIDECAKVVSPNPVFGNGDILSYEDYVKSRERAPHISGVMICRGGLIKPWLFTEIKEKKLWDISSSERFDILKKYTNYGLEHWGSDSRGVENTRRFLLEWCSFLHRYVPVGLLERPPQKINERPPSYIGRDDLETLMASTNCADWIKLSEMLLGPVPDNFMFLPKHKANSYS